MLRIVCFSLLSSMFQLFVAVSAVSAFAFLLTPCSSDRDGIFHFQDILFSSALACIVERVKLCHPKVRVMWQHGGQKRDLILEPVSGPISASLGGASIVSPKGSAGLLAGLSLIFLIQVTSLLGWCSLRRFKSARTTETQPGCLKKSFSQVI